MRSVRLHVSENLFQQRRSAAIGFTIDAANFSHPFSIYGGHFLDMLFAAVGDPCDFNALIANQFESITLIETGETVPTTAPDQVLLNGTLQNGAVFSVHIEGGKRNNFGVQLDITGIEGDLKLSNTASFHNLEDNKVFKGWTKGEPNEPIFQEPELLPTALDALGKKVDLTLNELCCELHFTRKTFQEVTGVEVPSPAKRMAEVIAMKLA